MAAPPSKNDEPVGRCNVIASLSNGPISVAEIQRHITTDALLKQVIAYTKSSWPPKRTLNATLLPFYHVREELAVEYDCLTRSEHQLVIPVAMQQRILDAAHEGHPGTVRTKRKLRQVYWWPGMDGQIENLVKHCAACQDSAKSHKAIQPPPSHIAPPTEL